MELEVIEILTLSSDGAGGGNINSAAPSHWSRNTARPRYSLNQQQVKERRMTHRFTCFDVAEAVESEYDVLFAGRSNGAVVLWRIVPRNLFGGASKNDRVEESLITSSPHKGAITCLTHTRRGTYAALGGPILFSGATDHTIKVWNAWEGSPLRGHCLQTLAEHRGSITGLAFAGGATLISTARDGSVRLWRPQRGRKLLRFPFFCCVKSLSIYPLLHGGVGQPSGPGQPETFAAIWPTVACVWGGEHWTLYCGDSDGTVSVFHRNPTTASQRLAEAGRRSDNVRMKQLADSEVFLQRRWSHLHSLAITGLVLVPEHNFLLSLGNDGVCRVLDYLQGNTFMTLESDGHSLFSSVAWDLAHEQLVLADASGVVQVWNTYTGSLLLREKVATAVPATGPRRGHGSPALLTFHSSKADGVLYGMSPAEGCFFRWKMARVEGYAVLGRHDEAIVGLGFQGTKTSSRRAEVAAANDITATVADLTKAAYKLEQNEAIKTQGNRHVGHAPHNAKPHGRESTEERGSRIVDSSGGLQRQGERDTPMGGGSDAGLRGSVVKRGLQGSARGSSEGAHEEDGDEGFGFVMLSACVDGTVRAWEPLGMGEKYRMRHGRDEEVASMLVLPGGSVMATGINTGCVRFWRLDTGGSESIQAHDNTVSALAACRDCQGSLLFASGGFEGAIVLWTAHAKDGVTDSRVPKIESVLDRAHGTVKDGSDCEILCLAFVATDAPVLASAGNDLVVRCWRVRDRGCVLLATLKGHTDSVETLLADGVYILSGSCDGTVRVWNVSCFALDGTSNAGGSWDSCAIAGLSAGAFDAHPGGVVDMAVVADIPAIHPLAAKVPLKSGRDWNMAYGSGGGLLMTCGKAEGIVKIWDYTFVGESGASGMFLSEIRSLNESLFQCVACSHAANGEPLLFAGTSDGSIVQLSWSRVDCGSSRTSSSRGRRLSWGAERTPDIGGRDEITGDHG